MAEKTAAEKIEATVARAETAAEPARAAARRVETTAAVAEETPAQGRNTNQNDQNVSSPISMIVTKEKKMEKQFQHHVTQTDYTVAKPQDLKYNKCTNYQIVSPILFLSYINFPQ